MTTEPGLVQFPGSLQSFSLYMYYTQQCGRSAQVAFGKISITYISSLTRIGLIRKSDWKQFKVCPASRTTFSAPCELVLY